MIGTMQNRFWGLLVSKCGPESKCIGKLYSGGQGELGGWWHQLDEEATK